MLSGSKFCFAVFIVFGGCASMTTPDWSAYIVEVHNSSQVTKDQADCQIHAENYKGRFDGGSIAVSTIQGGADNVSEVPINPVIPLAGAAGSAGSALLMAIDPFGVVKRGVYIDCLRQKTAFDHAALVLEQR